MTNPVTPNQGYALPVETQNLKFYRALLEQNLIDIDQDIAALMLAVANKATLAQLQALIGGFELLANKNAPGGYAGLDGTGRMPAGLLPSYVDDVVEFATLEAFPATGEASKIYVAINNGRVYRWSGSTYVEISTSPGSTDVVPEGSINRYHTDQRVLAALLQNQMQARSNLGVPSGALSGFRNRFINGRMRIMQRTSPVSIMGGTRSYTLDRFAVGNDTTNNVYSVSQSTDAPTVELGNSLRIEPSTVGSTGINGAAFVEQVIEGSSIGELIEKPFNISFWVKSSSAGVKTLRLRKTAFSCAIPYTISQPGVWEFIRIEIANGLPIAGNWNVFAGSGLSVMWYFASRNGNGQANQWVTGAPSNPWLAGPDDITVAGGFFMLAGVQIETGLVTSPFEVRPLGLELALCQRYYETGNFAHAGYNTAGAAIGGMVKFTVPKAIASPLITQASTANVNCSATPQRPFIAADGFLSQRAVTAAAAASFREMWTAEAEL